MTGNAALLTTVRYNLFVAVLEKSVSQKWPAT